VSEFLVETYHPTVSRAPDEPDPQDVADAVAELSRQGHDVSLVRAIVVPDDETCFYLFEAREVAAVLESVRRSRVRVLRTLPAMSAWMRPEEDQPARDRSVTHPIDFDHRGGGSSLRH
jgi:hypothetical protein